MNITNIKNLDLNLLTLFVLLWDTRSVSRTSERLSVTQPAISHSLKRLRDAVGDPLFLSGRQGLIPTERAAELISPIKQALDLIRDTVGSTTPFDAASSKREFRIAVLDMVDVWLLPRLIEVIQAQAPGVIVQGVPVPRHHSAHTLLESGDIDIVVDNRPVTGTFINCERLAALKLVTMVWDKEPIKGRRMPLALYLERPHIALQDPNKSTNVVDQALARAGYSRNVRVIATNLFTVPAVAARTGYLINIPDRVATLFKELFALSIYDPPIELEPIALYCSSHERFDSDPALRWLRSTIHQLLNESE